MKARLRRYAHTLQSLEMLRVATRRKVLRFIGIEVADDAIVLARNFFGSNKATIGSGAFISVNCFLDGSDWIKIGARTHLASGVQVITSTHEMGDADCRAGEARTAPVTIGAGCWLGAGTIVLPGVTIADGCTVGAGSLVREDTTPNGLYFGTPAVRVRELAA